MPRRKVEVMRKGEVQQVFIYLMVIIIAGAVLLLGYSSISNIMDKGCDVEKNNFVSSLKREFTRNERVGSSSMVELIVPCSYEAICFVSENAGEEDTSDPVIVDNINAGTGVNVFLREGSSTEPLLSMGNLETDEEVLCVTASAGRFVFRLTGVGRGKVKVTAG
jgi:hypothetical protein